MSTSLTLQALLKSVISRAGLGVPGEGRVTGLPPAARALFLAAAAHGQAPPPKPGTTGTTVVVVVPTDADVEQAVGDIRFFLGALEGLSEAAAASCVLPFPSHEVDPYRGLSPHLGVLSARAKALHAAASGRARVIVASAAALLPRVSAPRRLLAASVEIGAGADVDPYALASLLGDAGFTRQDPVDAHGEFCVRGGVIDIFPAGSAQPVRLDFVGDTVESIRHFDPATQRSTGEAESITIVPLREVFSDDGSKAEGGKAGGGTDEGGTREAGGGVNAVDDDIDLSAADADPNEGDESWQWDEEAEPPAAYRLPASVFSGDRSSSLLDYVAQPLVFVCEPGEVQARVEKSLEQLAASWRDATARGQTAPEPGKLFASLDDVTALLELGTEIEELAIDEGVAQSEDPPYASSAAFRLPPSTASPPPGSAGASATGWRRSAVRGRRARPCSSSPPRRAAPSASSSSSATTS